MRNKFSFFFFVKCETEDIFLIGGGDGERGGGVMSDEW